MSDSRSDKRRNVETLAKPQYTLREQRRWNMKCNQSIWGDSSPESSPEPIVQNSIEEKSTPIASENLNQLKHNEDVIIDKRKQLVRIDSSSDESSDEGTYGPTVAEYESIMEQKRQEERIAKEKADKEESQEMQDWKKRQKRKAAMRQAAINASYTPNPWL